MTYTVEERSGITIDVVKTPKQILEDAANILEAENAWTQGDYHQHCDVAPSGVSHCADGALYTAAGMVTFEYDEETNTLRELRPTWEQIEGDGPVAQQYRAYEQAYQLASDHVRGLGISGGIIAYNDKHGRLQSEVVAALRGTAAQLA